MFIQVIEGRTKDPEGVHEQMRRWERELKPGAIGFLGSAGGCTDSGDCILVARFESADAARRNSDRPEQTRWWEETERCFDGPVRFHDTEDVELIAHGPIDDAHFVQVMEGHVTDRERAREIDRQVDEVLADTRPEMLGAVTGYFDDGEFTGLVYFSSEEEARDGERRELPEEVAQQWEQWDDVVHVDRYLDITDPWLTPA